MTTPTTDAREREALTVLDEVLRGRLPHNHPDAKQALAAVRAELTEVRLWLADANAQVTFYAKECATLRAALEYKGEALDAYRAAILATERARVRAVVENAPGYQRQGLFVSRADILARLDAEPTP